MSLTTLPDELLSLIFTNLSSFTDLRNLLLTSKNTYSAWQSNQRSILWAIGQASIPAFDEGLIAVRATNISKSSVLSGTLPPSPYPISTLPGQMNKPTLSETKKILSFNSLAKHLVSRSRDPETKKKFFLPHKWFFDSGSWSSETWKLWTENYHRAVYWYLTAGAMLSRAYCEPLLSETKPGNFLESLIAILEGRRDYSHFIQLVSSQAQPVNGSQSGGGGHGGGHGGGTWQFQSREQGWFTAQEKEYLQGIALYNSQCPEKWEYAFSDLERLFVQETKRLSHQNQNQNQNNNTGLPCIDQGLKRPLSAIYGLDTHGHNTQGLKKNHAQTLFSSLCQLLYLIDGDMRYLISLPGDTPSEGPGDKVVDEMSVFLLGSFTLMDLTLHQREKEDGSGGSSASASIPPSLNLKDSVLGLRFPYMHNLLKKTHDLSGLPNVYDNPIRKTPPIASFFVEYMLRKYLGLKFNYTMFDATREVRCAWCAFHQNGGLMTGFGPGCGCAVGGDIFRAVGDKSPGVGFDEDAWYY